MIWMRWRGDEWMGGRVEGGMCGCVDGAKYQKKGTKSTESKRKRKDKKITKILT